jgi:subtilisin-like proprotein convertase family protein
VTYDTVTPPTAGTATKSALDTSHNVRVSGLQACTQYFYSVSSTDAAANSATYTNGGAYYTFTTGVNVNPTYQYTGPAVPIPDNNPTGATAIINVTDNKPVQKVTVRVNLTHTFDGDIALHLIGPDGTDVILSNKRGSSGDNFTNTVFDDDATTPIASGTAPFTGTFKPDAALSAFNGKNALGQWKFFVVDNASVDTGNILDWDLVLTYPPQACGPAVEYQSSSKSDSCIGTGTGGGNGVIEPGETVVLPVTAHNSGTAAVTGISGTLTTSTPGVTITDNFATFPDLAVDAVGVSLPDHFSFFVDPSFPCGNTIDFAIHFTGNEGSWTSTFTLSTGTPGTTSATLTSTDVPKTITDNATVQSNLVVASTGTVLDVNVTLSITHTWDGDLNLRLIGPNGTVVPLSSRRGSSGDNFTGTTFDDSATTPIASGTAPFSGSFKPESPLAALNGIAANGTWKLEVNDAASGDTGSLTAWSIQLTTSGNPSCLSCTPIQVAGEATNLRFLSGSKTGMEWSAALYATSYNLYRGVAADLPLLLNASDDSCRRLVVAGTSTGSVITEAPSSGAIYWYLVLGQNGTGEGPAGNATAGPRVLNSSGACP